MIHKNDTSEKIKVGEQIQIRLPGLGGAGYQWFQKSSPTKIISLSESVDPPNEQMGIGASAEHIFTIKGLQKGKYTLHLQQNRQWESDNIPPINEKILTIEVE